MWLVLWSMMFTPGVELYASELDGAWEFGEVVERAEYVTEREEYLTVGQTVPLGGDTPRFLVEEGYGWSFSGIGHTWLVGDYEVSSAETEVGFDEPVLLIYLGTELIFKENEKESGSIELYLGELSGNQRLRFYAGETGDLLKPTQVILKNLKLLKEKQLSENKLLVRELPPQGELVRRYVNFNEPGSFGRVLGDSHIESVAQESWQAWLKAALDKPQVLVSIWLAVTVIVSLVLHSKGRKETA